jgi:hypothetical protein
MPKIEELRERLRYTRLPFFRSEDDGSFEQNIEEGLTSSTFDLHQNLLGGGKQPFFSLHVYGPATLFFVLLSMGSINAYDWLAYAKPCREALLLFDFTTTPTRK